MADPVTLALIAGAGAAVSTAGQFQQQRGQQKIAQYQADVAENNRKTAIAQGAEEETRLRREQRRRIGAQRAGLAEAGIFGKSSFDLLEESMINAEMDVLNTRAQSLQQAQNFEQQRVGQAFQAKQLRRSARTTLLKSPFRIRV